MKDRARGTIEMASAMAVSGTIGWIVVRSGQSAVSLVFWRCLFGAIALAAVCSALRAFRSGVDARILVLSALGGAAIVANWLLLFASFPLASISIATAVYSTQPFILVGLGAAFLGEKITATRLAWLAVAFAGVVAIIQARPSAHYVGSGYLAGIALAFGAAFFYAVASIFAKKLTGTPPHLIALIQVCVGVVMLAPFTSFADVPADRAGWGSLVALGVIYTGLLFTLQYGAIQRLPTHLVGSLYYIYPAVAIVVDVLAFDHRLQLAEASGIGAILLGAAGMNLGWTFAVSNRRHGAAAASSEDAIARRGAACSGLRFVAEHAGGQKKHGPEQPEERVERDADEAERQRDQPHERPQDQRKQGQRPAQDQQDEPADEGENDGSPPGLRASRMKRLSSTRPCH